MNILLTGYPRVGKTTLILKILSRLNGTYSGFYTREILNEHERREGFKVIKLSDESESVLAHIEGNSQFRVGKYNVFVTDFENFTIEEMEKDADYKIIDEIGKMELFSNKFKKLLEINLGNGNVIGTITKKGGGEFVQSVKERNDVKLIEITLENRNNIFDEIMGYLEE